MNGSVDPPLLSQDEFFRHLNLQSVHLFSEKGGGGGNGGKYMYRRALKERLRANTKTNYNQNRPYKTYKSKGRSLIHSPQVSPCKGLSDSQRRKIFGRPRVRVELKFEENENDSEEVKACIRKYNGLIKPLLGNCHVLRHPGIKRELEARTEAKQDDEAKTDITCRRNYLPTAVQLPQLAPNRLGLAAPPTESLQVMAVHTSPALPLHCIAHRTQPGRKRREQHLKDEAVRKLATRALFGHGTSNVKLTSLGPSSVTKLSKSDQYEAPQGTPALPTLHLQQPVETTTLADGSTTIAHKCQICLKIFGRRSHLVRHMKNLHSAEPPPPMSVLATLAQEPQPPTVQLIHNTPPSRKISTNGPLPKGQQVNGNSTEKYTIVCQKDGSRVHQCNLCNKTFVKLSHMTRHLERVTPCTPENTEMEQLAPEKIQPASPLVLQPHHPSLTATHIQKGRNNNNEKKLVSLKIHKLLRETQFYNAKHQNQITVVTPQCKMCGVKYRVSPCPLRSWQEAVQSASLCEKCRALQQLKQNAALSPESLNGLMVHQPNENHICDICNKIFVSRSKMIRHMTNVHPLNIHKVDLARFATFKTSRATSSMPDIPRQAIHSPWIEPSPTKQPHLKRFISA